MKASSYNHPYIYPYIHKRSILFGETDAARIVYTPRFSDYCMEAAEVWFRDYLKCDWYQMNAYEELGTPVVHMELDFFAPLRGNDQLAVTVLLDKIGRSTIALSFEGIRTRNQDDKKIKSFTAKIIFCFFSNKTEKSKPIPEQQLKMLEYYKKACDLK